MRISDYIPKGKNNAVTLQHLRAVTGKAPREIARCIKKEREEGQVILTSSRGGYWLLDSADNDAPEQLRRFIAYMDGKNTFSAVKSAKEALRAIENEPQQRIEGA